LVFCCLHPSKSPATSISAPFTISPLHHLRSLHLYSCVGLLLFALSSFSFSQKFLRPRVYTMTCVLPSHLPPSLRALVFRGLSQEAPFTPSTICSTSDCISIVSLPSVPSRQSYSVLFFGGYLLSFADIFTLRFTLGSAHFTSLSLHFHELVALFFSWGHFLPPSPHYSSLALLMC
jgi:hypothetical protein